MLRRNRFQKNTNQLWKTNSDDKENFIILPAIQI